MKKKIWFNQRSEGLVTLVTMLFLLGISVLGFGMLSNSQMNVMIAQNHQKKIQAYHAAIGLTALIAQETIDNRGRKYVNKGNIVVIKAYNDNYLEVRDGDKYISASAVSSDLADEFKLVNIKEDEYVLKALELNKFITVDTVNGNKLIANADTYADEDVFTVTINDDGKGFQSASNNLFVYTENDGIGHLKAGRSYCGFWEKFLLEDTGNSELDSIQIGAAKVAWEMKEDHGSSFSILSRSLSSSSKNPGTTALWTVLGRNVTTSLPTHYLSLYTKTDITFNANSVDIKSEGHTEGDFRINGNNINSHGNTITYVGNATINGPDNDVVLEKSSSQPEPVMPVTINELRDKAMTEGTYFMGNTELSMSGVDILVEGSTDKTVPQGSIIFIENGKLDIKNDFNAVVTIASAGDKAMKITGSTVDISAAHKDVLIYTDGSLDIINSTLSTNGIIKTGAEAKLIGNNVHLKGILWSDSDIVINGNNHLLESLDNGGASSGGGTSAGDFRILTHRQLIANI